MDDAARQLMEQCHPHVPPALLAHLYRLGQPFPDNTAKLADPRPDYSLQWLTGRLLENGQYVRYDCPDCHSLMFQPNTERGIRHARTVDQAHKPDCCAERAERYAQTGVPAVWPDRLDE